MSVGDGVARVPVWGVPRASVLPPVTGRQRTGVCVVGLGAAGLSAVIELRRHGLDVIGIDAHQVGAGASGRNGGFLLAGPPAGQHRAVAVLGALRAEELYRLTLSELDRAAHDMPQAVRRTGSLRIAIDDDELADCRHQRASLEAAGLPVEPYLGPEGEGLLFPRDAVVDPLLRCQLLAEQARSAGARLLGDSPALMVDGRRVVTPGGEIRCDAVVIAVDGGIERLLPSLDGRVRTARVQMLATAPAPEVELPRPVYARWGYDYWQQLPDRCVALGGFRDHGGEAEWTTDAAPTGPVQRLLEAHLRDRLGVRAEITHRWAGTIAFTDDHLPVVEQVAPGVFAAGAYSGTGNLLGPICGRAAARLSLDEPTDLDGILLPPAPAGASRRV